MDGRIVGLSLTSVLAAPSLRGLDPEVLEELLISGEIGALAGIRDQDKTDG